MEEKYTSKELVSLDPNLNRRLKRSLKRIAKIQRQTKNRLQLSSPSDEPQTQIIEDVLNALSTEIVESREIDIRKALCPKVSIGLASYDKRLNEKNNSAFMFQEELKKRKNIQWAKPSSKIAKVVYVDKLLNPKRHYVQLANSKIYSEQEIKELKKKADDKKRQKSLERKEGKRKMWENSQKPKNELSISITPKNENEKPSRDIQYKPIYQRRHFFKRNTPNETFINHSKRTRHAFRHLRPIFNKPEHADKFNIFVKLPIGKCIIIEAKNCDTIASLKIRIHQKYAAPPKDQRLYYGTKQLHDKDVVEHCNITVDRVLHLQIHLLGGTNKNSCVYNNHQCHSSSFRRNFSSSNVNNGQYSNLNLNQNHKNANVNPVYSKNDISLDKCSKFTTFNDQQERQQFVKNVPETSLSTNYNLNVNYCQNKQLDKKISSDSNSTLQIHISAYENSVESISESNNVGENGLTKNDKQKSWKISKESPVIKVQNIFEYPRQQENQNNSPEVMQFKTSQRLLNPNEPPAKKSRSNIQDDARKCIRAAKKVPDSHIKDIITQLIGNFTDQIQDAILPVTTEMVKSLMLKSNYDTSTFIANFFKEGDCVTIEDGDGILGFLFHKLVIAVQAKGRTLKFSDIQLCHGPENNQNSICFIFRHHSIPKFTHQILKLHQVLPSTVHPSECSELLPERLIKTRSEIEASRKLKKLNTDKSNEDMGESGNVGENNRESAEENFELDNSNEEVDDDEQEILPDEVINELILYIEDLISQGLIPNEIVNNKIQLFELLSVLLKSGKYQERASPMNFKEVEKTVIEYLHIHLANLQGLSPRFQHSVQIATIILTYARLLTFGSSWVVQFKKILQGIQVNEDDVTEGAEDEDLDAINNRLNLWLASIDNSIIHQIRKNGFKDEYPLSIRETSITSGMRNICKFFCFLTSFRPDISPTTFLKNDELIKELLNEWKAFLATSYCRNSHFHSAEKNFAEGLQDTSRTTYSDEADRIRLLTAVKMYSATILGLKILVGNKGYLSTESSKAGLQSMVDLYENKRSSVSRTLYALTEIDSDYLVTVSPPTNAYELQRAVLCLLAPELGCRLGSLIPLADSNCEAISGSPGILLKDIKFEWIPNPEDEKSFILKVIVIITHHKTQRTASGALHYTLFFKKKKHCTVKYLLQLLDIRGVLTTTVEDGLRLQNLQIKEECLLEPLFVKPEKTSTVGITGSIYNRLTKEPLTVWYIEEMFMWISKTLGIPRMMLDFRVWRMGNATIDAIREMEHMKEQATMAQITERLKTNTNWESDMGLSYLNYGKNVVAKTLDAFLKYITANQDSTISPLAFHAFAVDIFPNINHMDIDHPLCLYMIQKFKDVWFPPKLLKTPAKISKLLKYRIQFIVDEINYFIWCKTTVTKISPKIYDCSEELDFAQMKLFYSYPLVTSLNPSYKDFCPYISCDYDGKPFNDGHLEIHVQQNIKDIACKICDTQLVLAKSKSAPYNGLLSHWDTMHTLKYACRTCQDLMCYQAKYQCQQRQHNVVLTGSLCLHFKATTHENISDILSMVHISANQISSSFSQQPQQQPLEQQQQIHQQPQTSFENKQYAFISSLDLVPSEILNWTVDDMAKFTNYLCNSQIADTFRHNDIDGRGYLGMEDTDYVALGITSYGPKMKLVKACNYLKDQVQ